MRYRFDALLLQTDIATAERLAAQRLDAVLTLDGPASSFSYTVAARPPGALPFVTTDLEMRSLEAGGVTRGPTDLLRFGAVGLPDGDVVVLGLGYDETLSGRPISTEIVLRVGGAGLDGAPDLHLSTPLRGGVAISPYAPGEAIDLTPFAAGGDDGRSGGSTWTGGLGDDVFHVDDPHRVIVDPGGSDEIRASVSYALSGPGIERLTAIGDAPIRLDGSAAGEDITGNDAANILVGHGGADRMTGGSGADHFVLTGPGTDPSLTIEDFSRAEGDRLAIDDRLLGLGGAAVDLRAVQPALAAALQAAGRARYDRENGLLALDAEGDGQFDAQAALGEGLRLTLSDIVLF